VNQIQQLSCRASRHRISRSQGGQTWPEGRISNSRRLFGGFGEAALVFDLDGNLVNSSRPPDVDAPWSRQWRKKPVAPDGGDNEAASSPEGAKPIVPGLAGERWL
jgi:hypothetical protein